MLVRMAIGVLAAVAIWAPAAGDYVLGWGDGIYYDYGAPHRLRFDVAEGPEGLVGEFHLSCGSIRSEFYADRILSYNSVGGRASFVCVGWLNGEPGWLASVQIRDSGPESTAPDWIQLAICGSQEFETSGFLVRGDIVVNH